MTPCPRNERPLGNAQSGRVGRRPPRRQRLDGRGRCPQRRPQRTAASRRAVKKARHASSGLVDLNTASAEQDDKAWARAKPRNRKLSRHRPYRGLRRRQASQNAHCLSSVLSQLDGEGYRQADGQLAAAARPRRCGDRLACSSAPLSADVANRAARPHGRRPASSSGSSRRRDPSSSVTRYCGRAARYALSRPTFSANVLDRMMR